MHRSAVVKRSSARRADVARLDARRGNQYLGSVAEPLIVYQIMNFDREEILYGTCPEPLDKEIERLAKDPRGPTKLWKHGEVVSWKPITEPLEPASARMLHREFEKGTPPNNFKVLATYTPE